jgi:hypothetical protein
MVQNIGTRRIIMKKLVCTLGIMLSAVLLSACGTIEVGLEEQPVATAAPILTIAGETVETPVSTLPTSAPSPPATTTPESGATIEPLASEEADTAESKGGSGTNPPGWLHYQNDDFGIEFWHPPGTFIEEREPYSPEFWSGESEPIIEVVLFSVNVLQEAEGGDDSPAPQNILEIKAVANPDALSVGAMADLFSRRCPGEILEQLEPTAVSVHLMGYRYTCEGMMLFTELWAPYGGQTDMLLGAAWAEMFSPLSEDILATVSFFQ